MKLTVLCDNNTIIDRYLLAEPGVSCFIEDDGFRLLFDMGYSDVFMRNANALGIDISRLDAAAFSHGHNDHTGGLAYYSEKYDMKELRVLGHSATFEAKQHDGMDVGSPLSTQCLSKICRLELGTKPVKLTKRLTYLGEIPRRTDFEKCGFADGVPDDTALVYDGDEGLFIVTGCSHSGICNIVQYARQTVGKEKVSGIIGGFHMFDTDAQFIMTAQYLRTLGAKRLWPCHCVSLAVKAGLMARGLPVLELGSGEVIEAV